jgi:hypothetical protein
MQAASISFLINQCLFQCSLKAFLPPQLFLMHGLMFVIFLFTVHNVFSHNWLAEWPLLRLQKKFPRIRTLMLPSNSALRNLQLVRTILPTTQCYVTYRDIWHEGPWFLLYFLPYLLPFPWQSQDSIPEQFLKNMRYLFMETHIILLTHFVKM